MCSFCLSGWRGGKVWLKQQVAQSVCLDPNALRWRTEFLDYLKWQRAEGRSLVLLTGSDMRVARQVADYLKLFDLVLASDGSTKVCGESKRNLLVREFGEKGSITPLTVAAARVTI